MTGDYFYHKTNQYIKQDTPFFFLIDFEKQSPIVLPIEACAAAGIFFRFHGKSDKSTPQNIAIKSRPIPFEDYRRAFESVKRGIAHGNSFLTNLTFPTPIRCSASLENIYQAAQAPYKLLFKKQFVVFSPEGFIKIKNNIISTFPMKGTLMSTNEEAERQLLSNKKEIWEHNTIVDLMRNDLSMVASDVKVKRFRYISEIMTQKGTMLQTSSEISGHLNDNWQNTFGELLMKMLPAGSVSGAPKRATLKIIKGAETGKRGYYCGIFGTYIHGEVESAVAIRYIEQRDRQKYFRSGGGITFRSNAEEEYRELIDKVYVPVRPCRVSCGHL